MFEEIRGYSFDQIKNANPYFEDPRLVQLFIRYKARNFPGSLTDEELLSWESYQQERLFGHDNNRTLTVELFRKKIQEIKADPEQYPERQYLLDELLEYVEQIERNFTEVTA